MRRTTSIDVTWPNGQGGHRRFDGRARDVLTSPEGGPPQLLTQDRFEALLSLDRTIVAIAAEPERPGLRTLVGVAGGGGLRRAIAEGLPEERRNATPLHLLLDDLAGTSLVSTWAWVHWDPNWQDAVRAALGVEEMERLLASRTGVCTGFAPGSSAFDEDLDRTGAPAADLRNPEDPDGWHAFPDDPGISMRRARRIDVWLDDRIRIDSAFQDSAPTPAGGRRAVHEYRLSATADPVTLELLTIEADARVLPHSECPGAVPNLPRLLGTPLPALRDKVLEQLKGVAGCTHLNDAARALADVPVLAAHLHPVGAATT